MTKKQIDDFIISMKKGEFITKTTPWMDEMRGNVLLEVRFIGIKLPTDWEEIFPASNNVLLKFTHTRDDSRLEYFIANKPPFFKFHAQKLGQNAKWELVLGEMKNRLKKDKQEFLHHKEKPGNLYKEIVSYLKP